MSKGFGFAGFSLAPAKKPPVRAFRDEEEDDDGEEEPTVVKPAAPPAEDDEVDPLDAFMAGVQAEVAKEATIPAAPKARIADFEDEDPVESYIKHRQAVGKAAAAQVRISADDTDEDVYAAAKAVDGDAANNDDSDDDGTVVVGGKKRIEPIPPLDHSQIKYADFEKCFYEEHKDIASMTDAEVDTYRKELEIKISGPDPVRPVKTFAQLGFEATLAADIAKQGYTDPTPIQRQAIPVALSGRDIIGIAQTGSGKTAAFVLPMITHILDQPDLEKGEGPIAVVSNYIVSRVISKLFFHRVHICAPTRELAQQIYVEAKKFAKNNGIRVSAIYGGLTKNEQFRELKAGTEVVVATPGRLIDMIKMKACKMTRTTYLVLDEADRMFDMGFEPQVRSIVGQIRPDRQTLLFSATFKRSVENLARDILIDPLRINIGTVGEANVDIQQEIVVLNNDSEKWPWLMPLLQQFVDDGSVIIFVSTKIASEELSKNLNNMGFHSAALHGDKDQTEREKIMFAFKNENLPILVATDVAARGLDIKTIRNVVNYDIARDIDSHTHRIGRTGRAGQLGIAWTLITNDQTSFACELLRSLEISGHPIPPQLTELAKKDSRFRVSTRKGPGGRGGARGGGRGRGRAPNVGGAGLGFDNGPGGDGEFNPPPRREYNNDGPGGFGRGRGGQSGGGVNARFQNSFIKADVNQSEEDGGSMRPNKVARVIPPVNPQAQNQQSYQQQSHQQQQQPQYQQQQSYQQQQQPQFQPQQYQQQQQFQQFQQQQQQYQQPQQYQQQYAQQQQQQQQYPQQQQQQQPQQHYQQFQQQKQQYQQQSQPQQRTNKFDNDRYNTQSFDYNALNAQSMNRPNNRFQQQQNAQPQQPLPPNLLQIQQQINAKLQQQANKPGGDDAYDPFAAGGADGNDRGRGGRDQGGRDSYRDNNRDRDGGRDSGGRKRSGWDR